MNSASSAAAPRIAIRSVRAPSEDDVADVAPDGDRQDRGHRRQGDQQADLLGREPAAREDDRRERPERGDGDAVEHEQEPDAGHHR